MRLCDICEIRVICAASPPIAKSQRSIDRGAPLAQASHKVRAMVSRITACWLAVLVLAPFTAPFPTCDLATLFGGTPAPHTPAKLPGAATLADETSVANVPAISHIGRVRLLQLSALSGSVRESLPPSAALKLVARAPRHIDDRVLSSTILRV